MGIRKPLFPERRKIILEKEHIYFEGPQDLSCGLALLV